MSSYRPTYEQMRGMVENVDLAPIVERAKKYFGLTDEQVPQALGEYRHFMFLLWQNNEIRNEMPVVPTKLADAIWHAHLLSNREYNGFCEAAQGKIIYHNADDYQEGTASLLAAVAHTRKLHAKYGGRGFVTVYLDTRVGGNRKDDTAVGGATGGDSPTKADADGGSDGSAAASTSTGDGGAASCAAGCGG